jgi:REP element-mobilizing transposase RayT
MKTFYRRHLPHWQPDGSVIFVTLRLYDSLPKSALDKIVNLRESLKMEMDKGKTPTDDVMLRAQRLFDLMEDCLDEELQYADSGSPRWMEKPEVATIVREAMKFYEGERFSEHRYVIMPNHVHWLIEPFPIKETNFPEGRENETIFWPISSILKSVKGYSAREANRILGRSGHFWQEESFDHWIRDQREYNMTVRYIDDNPVKAGLCGKPEEWQWSSAGKQTR